jgi:small-conductance mechanosensitive channel
VAKAPPSPHFEITHLLDASFWRGLGESTLETFGQVVGIVILYLLVKAGVRRMIRRIIVPMMARSEQTDGVHAARLRTLAGLLNSVVGYLLTFIFAVMLLRAFHLDPIPVLTTASVAGLAVGFGAQKLVKDVISGFFILLENQYAVGDYVTIGAVTGVVEDVGMRTTRIRDDVGKLYMISNGDITQVCNQSRGAVAAYIEIGVAPGTDVTAATSVVNKVGKELADERTDLGFVKPPSVQGITGMDAAKITLRVSCATENLLRLTDAQIALRSLLHQRLVDAGIALA